jgi:hydroxymethylglutaryl-CoA synthase
MRGKIGIVAYGVYIPKWRIKVEEIAKIWGHDAESIKRGLLVEEKSVPYMDEDTVTIAIEAARNALKMDSMVRPEDIGAIYVGSESHTYAVKPTATIVAEAIGATPSVMAADTEFACKAATAGIQACMGLVEAGYIRYGMSIGADVAQSQPKDPLEYTVSAGGAAYVVGKERVLAEVEGTYSYTQDVPDFWRREGAEFPQHGGRFTGEPGYFAHVVACAKGLMEKLGTKPKDYDYVVFHEPNGKFPLRASKMLGFPEEKVLPGLIVTKIGNTYSGSSLIALAHVLDQCEPGDKILMTSYGSGAGSDAFSLVVTDQIKKRKNGIPVGYYLDEKRYVDYATYSKFRAQFKGFVV